MYDPARWQSSSPDASRRELPGPYWAEVRRQRFHQMPNDGADPGAWSWAVRRPGAAGHGCTGHTTVKAGTAASDRAAKQAVEDWLAAHPLDADRTLWNVVAPVVAVLGAPTGAEAYGRLTRALTAAGFDVYEPDTDEIRLTPFESEDGTEESDPPPAGWPY
jgi:hypothetical protein